MICSTAGCDRRTLHSFLRVSEESPLEFASSSAVNFMGIPPTLPSFVEIVGTVRGRNSEFLLTLVLH